MPERRLSKIVVRCPHWVGDIVMATPALLALREAHPEAELHILVPEYARKVLEGLPGIDEIHIVRREEGRGWRRAREVARRLRPLGFDGAVLLTNSLSTAIEAFLARIPFRLGYAGDGRSFLLTRRLPRRRGVPEPMVESYLRLVATLGASTERRRYRLVATDEDVTMVEEWCRRRGLDDGRPVIGLNPGASFGASKLWMADRFAAAGDRLAAEHDAHVVLLGAPVEAPILEAIAGHMTRPVVNSVDDGRGLDLGELKAFMPRLALLVTTDTGPRAYAQAYRVPSVVVMGPTHPGWTAANLEQTVVVRHDVECGPCHEKECPLPRHECMELITVDEVVGAAREVMGRV